MSTTNSALRLKYNLPKTSTSNSPSPPPNSPSHNAHKHYDNYGTNEFIDVLQKECVIEEKKNKLLSEQNHEGLKKDLVDFSNQYTNVVYEHVSLLEKTAQRYESLVNENIKKEKAKQEYQEYLQQEKTKQLLTACEKIQVLKKKTSAFLASRRTE